VVAAGHVGHAHDHRGHEPAIRGGALGALVGQQSTLAVCLRACRHARIQEFFDLLVEGNRAWCTKAGALIVVASKLLNARGKPARTHSLDTGAAWVSLALEGTRMNLVVHGMEGFDYERASTVVRLPPDHQVECMVAVGHHGKIEDLPEAYRPREAPSDRKPISEFVVEGAFPAA